MTLALVPVPPGHLDGCGHLWRPYIEAISQRDRCDPAEKVRMLYAGEAQAFFIWDDEHKKTLAFIGVRYVLRGQERQAELIWLMGENRAMWVHLFAELETYLRDVEHCRSARSISRRGWSKLLKQSGYRETHVIMEKELGDAGAS